MHPSVPVADDATLGLDDGAWGRRVTSSTRPRRLLSAAGPTLAAPAGAISSPQSERGDAAAAVPGTAPGQPFSPLNGPAPASAQLAAGLVLLALMTVLAAVAIWSDRRRSLARRQTTPPPPTTQLPGTRWGATPHERLHDARYLDRILDAELNGGQPTEGLQQAQPASRQPAGDEAGAAERSDD